MLFYSFEFVRKWFATVDGFVYDGVHENLVFLTEIYGAPAPVFERSLFHQLPLRCTATPTISVKNERVFMHACSRIYRLSDLGLSFRLIFCSTGLNRSRCLSFST